MSEEHDKTGTAAPATENDAPSSGDAPAEGEIAGANEHVEQLKQEVAAAQDRFLRERAELENFKKRMQREKNEAVRYASEPLLRDLLPIVDNLERALAHGSATEGQSVVDGVQLVLKALLDTLARYGVKRLEAVGEPFDPAKHQAIAQVESAEHPANHVAEQHLIGYQLHDRLLRPAMVSVSRGKSEPAVESPQNSD